MEDRSIDLQCAITYVYKRKKLAIMCPVMTIRDSKEEFDVNEVAVMFNAPINVTYPCDAINAGENMIEPIIEAFGRKPDDAYSMIVDIEESHTKKSLKELKNEFDKLYPVEKHLKDEGYKIYPVFYVIDNIDKFKTSDDYEKDDNNYGEIARVKCDEFNLEGFIKETREIYKGEIDEQITPILLNYSDEKLIENDNIYDLIDREKPLEMEYINRYLSEANDRVIGIISGHDDTCGNIILLNGESIPYEDITSGEMEFYEDTAFVLTIALNNGYYIFKQYKFTSSFGKYIMLEDSGDLKDILLDVILKFKN